MPRTVFACLTVLLTACGGGGNTAPINPRVDVALDLEAAGTAVAGEPMEVLAIVNNGGPSLLSGPTLRLELTGEAELAAAPLGSQANVEVGSDFIVWTDFFVQAGFSRSFTFEVTPASPGSLTLELTYDSELTELNPANDDATLTLQVGGGG